MCLDFCPVWLSRVVPDLLLMSFFAFANSYWFASHVILLLPVVLLFLLFCQLGYCWKSLIFNPWANVSFWSIIDVWVFMKLFFIVSDISTMLWCWISAGTQRTAALEKLSVLACLSFACRPVIFATQEMLCCFLLPVWICICQFTRRLTCINRMIGSSAIGFTIAHLLIYQYIMIR